MTGTEQTKSKFLIGTLIINSVLLGVLAFCVCHAIAWLSVALDYQQVSQGRAVPTVVQRIFDYRPKDLTSVLSLAWAVTATCLFVTLAHINCTECVSRTALCLSIMLIFCLTGVCYFTFCIGWFAMVQVPVWCDMTPNLARDHLRWIKNTNLHPPSINHNIWAFATSAYCVALLVVGTVLKRRKQNRH